MVEILPFCGYHYKDRANISLYLSLPYDKLPKERLEEFRKKSPYNITHVICPGGEYEKAARLWREWKEQGVLERSSSPAFYIYAQRYTVPGTGEVKERKGLVALVGLKPFGEGVYPHEVTFPKPKADRLALLRATHANFGQIFFLTPDPEREFTSLLEEYSSADPLWQAEIPELCEVHTLWEVSDSTFLEKVKLWFRSASLFIADGHHRYETAWEFWQEKKKELSLPDEALSPYRFRMGTIVPFESPGLSVLPTHRLVQLSFASESQVLDSLSSCLSWRSFSSLEEGLSALGKEVQFLFLFPSGKVFGATYTGVPKKLSTPLDKVEVALLHEEVLPLLGVSGKQKDMGEEISYFRSPKELWEKVKGKEKCLGVCLPPLSLSCFQKVVEKGQRLPQKSTDFYPKMLSGVVIYDMENSFPSS